MDPVLYFGKIYIIEWLAAGDARTGWELYDQLQPIGLMSTPRIDVTYARVQNKAEFIASVRSIRDDFRATRKLPLLHVETHGFQDGICSTSGDEILWPELMEELIPLNQLTQLRLWFILGACEGLWGLKMVQPATRAAVLALLGPNRPISAGALATALQTFYRSIFRDRNGNAAFTAMNDAVDPTSPTFGIVNAEMLFIDVYRAFLSDRCTREELSERVAQIVAKKAAQFKAERGVGMWAHELEHVRALAWEHVQAHEDHFDHYRRQFFFIDLFPENDERFPVTIDQCREAAG
ncbi:MAG: hypothetical protein AB7H88_18125 [Vicinamibacterales bacterium]